ncbi:AB hydrolase superfamily protein [Abortiporus biennis]
MAQYSYLSTPNAEIAAALAKLPSPEDITGRDPAIIKANFLTVVAASNEMKKKLVTLPPDNELRVAERKIPVEDGEIRVLTYIPTPNSRDSTTEPFPLFIWLHGGGWTIGAPEMDDFILRRVCVELKISIVNVEYRTAPEFPFPIPINDCYDAVKWVISNASELNASPKKGLILGGSSAGGNMTAAIALRARDDPFFNKAEGKCITGQFLQFPSTIHPDVIPAEYKSELLSLKQHEYGPVITLKEIYAYLNFYKPDPLSPLFSPLLAPSHKGLAPAYLQICGQDPLRDEGLLYEKVLNKDGVMTKHELYPGYPHGGNLVLPEVRMTKIFEDDFIEGVSWLLQNGHSDVAE